MGKEIVKAISEMHEEEALRLVRQVLDRGDDPNSILNDCQEAMAIVGEKYEKGECYVPELVVSGLMLRKISDIVKPHLTAGAPQKAGAGRKLGKVVLGTVRGDIHDIGKDIVGLMLDVNGFEVHDLGVDVAEEKFVQAVRDVKPQIVAMSGFLTLAYDTMKSTIEALEKAGLRKGVKVMVGGGQINEMVKNYTKADGWGINAMTAVRLSKEWTPER